MVTHQREGHEHLARKAPDQSSRKANKTVSFDELVKINAEEFHRDAYVVPEGKMFSHLDDMVFLFRILKKQVNESPSSLKKKTCPFPQIIKQLNFYGCLVVESFLVSDYLQCHRLPGAVIPTMQYLSERAFPQGVDDLVPVCKMIVIND